MKTLFYNHGDHLQVFLLVKVNAIFLPEFLSVTWTPSELTSVHLVSKLVNRAINLLVLIEIVVEAGEHFVYVFVDPVLIFEFNQNGQSIDITKMFLHIRVVLDIIEEHQQYSHNFFRVVVVQDFAYLLDQGDGVVREELVGEFMIRKYPAYGNYIVGNLRVIDALIFQEFGNDPEILRISIDLCQLISFQKSEKSKCVSINRYLCLIDLLNHKPIEEFLCNLITLIKFVSID